MKIITAILIIILIFCLIFISSVRDYRIEKLEENVAELKRQLAIAKHDIDVLRKQRILENEYDFLEKALAKRKRQRDND